MKLIVNSEFGGYSVGDEITDKKLIAEILQSDQQFYVTKVAASPVKNGLVDMTPKEAK